MVHIQSKYPIDVSNFKMPNEIGSYWFGYLLARAYLYQNRARIVIRAPLSDIGHLYQLSRDLSSIKLPRRKNHGFGSFAQLIIDNKNLCNLLRKYGFHNVPSKELDSRHVVRGLLDGGGSISRNGRGNQSKYLKITFYSKSKKLLEWVSGRLGERKVVGEYQISYVGKKAVDVARRIYLNQSRYLERKLSALANEIFNKP